MKLEFDIFQISDIQFATKTEIKEGVLHINQAELKDLILEDKRFSRVDIALAHPGEKCRIIQVLDVIEPRAKVHETRKCLPYVPGPQPSTAGEGKTVALRGAAVVLSDYREKAAVTISRDPNGEIIDMSGPGAEAGPYGKTHNVVLLPFPKDEHSARDYDAALKIAGLKAAAYLAGAGSNLSPDETEIYDLPALTEIGRDVEGLPKVTYIFQILSLQFEPVPGEPTLYGSQADGIVPTILHPNEVLDGAVTSPLPCANVQTYHIQNHPIIKELYKRHGKELCFTGVIITTAPNNVKDYERMAGMAAGMAKWVIGADAAVLTKIGGGAPELVVARTAQKCEQLGIRTAIAMLNMGADTSDFKYGASTLFSMPEVDAIVSMGIPFVEITLPAVERVIGRPGLSPDGPPINGELVRVIRWIKGALCQMGSSKLTAVRY